MKIVVAGLARSGTSALFFKIRNSLPSNAKCLFEPGRYLSSPEDANRTVLCKILLYDANIQCDYNSFSDFDKKILIVRDPRDRLISMLLYRVCPSFYMDKTRTLKVIDLLKRKEANPRSVPVLEILKLARKFGWGDFWKKVCTSPKPAKLKRYLKNVNFWADYIYGRYFNLSMDFHEKHPEYFVIKYKDFIAGRIEDLERYLGFKLGGETRVDKDLDNISRTKKSGDWKNWFLKEDINYFKPRFSQFMKRYNYSNDWTINENPKIYPQYCSEYVMRLIEEKTTVDKGPQTKVF